MKRKEKGRKRTESEHRRQRQVFVEVNEIYELIYRARGQTGYVPNWFFTPILEWHV